MFSHLKTLPALAGIAGSLMLAGALAPAPAHAECGVSYPISALTAAASFTCGDKTYSNFSSVDFGSPEGTVQFLEPMPDKHEVLFTFGELPMTGLPTGIYTINYDVTVADFPTRYINDHDTQFLGSGDTGMVTSMLNTVDNPMVDNPSSWSAELQVSPDTYIQQWMHFHYQTPGPLPILGAGAAFGFSRKLRSRIKSAG